MVTVDPEVVQEEIDPEQADVLDAKDKESLATEAGLRRSVIEPKMIRNPVFNTGLGVYKILYMLVFNHR